MIAVQNHVGTNGTRGATPVESPPLDGATLRSHRVRVKTSNRFAWTVFRRKSLAREDLPPPRLERVAEGIWRFRAAATRPDHNFIELTLPARSGERFVGFGERFNAVDQRGWKLETWAEEGAIGLGETLSPLLTKLGASFNPFPKGPTTSYKPLPWFLSSHGYGLLIETTAPVFFDVAASDPERVTCAVMATAVDVWIFTGPTPATILERYTAHVGRAPGVPDWALAPWNDAVGGSGEVRRVASLLRRERIPSSAVWYEDWQGAAWCVSWAMRTRIDGIVARSPQSGLARRAWLSIFPVLRKPSTELYPDIEALNAELHQGGFKSLAYYYPYVGKADEEYASAAERGYFLKRASGDGPATFTMLGDEVSQIDLTNPGGRSWYKAALNEGLRLGFDGWMADFGEYTPIDSVTHDGEAGIVHHNRFPKLWAELHRETLDAARPDGDYVFFSRSCGLGQQGVSPVFWCGDSNTDFERWDGLPSNLRAMLSAGLSGIGIWSVDVGGYMSFFSRPRDRETLARWTELAAFQAVMRTHHGTHPRWSIQFDHDDATLAHYRTYARLHTALFPLLRSLVEEARSTGLPVCRALLLHYPHDPHAWTVEDEFLLGRDLLVAPVLERGASSRRVYLPAGDRWIDLWSGAAHAGGVTVEVEAPLGKIPLFLRARGAIALFDTYADTLVRRRQTADASVRTLDDAEMSLALVLGDEFQGPLALFDGTTVSWTIGPELAELRSVPPEDPRTLLPDDLGVAWRIAAVGEGKRGTVRVGGRHLEISSPIARRFTVLASR